MYNYITINNEKILPVIFYGNNRDDSFLHWNKKVCDKLSIPMNYIQESFPSISHGGAINNFAQKTHCLTDYWLFMETDSVFTRIGVIERLYEKVKDKKTVCGVVHQSNHKKNRGDGNFNHPYVSPSCMLLPVALWDELGRPSFDHFNENCDTAEEITYTCESSGLGSVNLMWPKSVIGLTEKECDEHGIDKKHMKSACGSFYFGRGTEYDGVFHTMCQTIPSSLDIFVERCKKIINDN